MKVFLMIDTCDNVTGRDVLKDVMGIQNNYRNGSVNIKHIKPNLTGLFAKSVNGPWLFDSSVTKKETILNIVTGWGCDEEKENTIITNGVVFFTDIPYDI